MADVSGLAVTAHKLDCLKQLADVRVLLSGYSNLLNTSTAPTAQDTAAVKHAGCCSQPPAKQSATHQPAWQDSGAWAPQPAWVVKTPGLARQSDWEW
jgi:hypothetical protein